MDKLLCIYHGNCADGFGAAWAVRHALGSDAVEFHPGVYGQSPPEVAGRDVVLVDFSYKRPVLEAMAAAARSLLILDHHKSAAEDLAGIGIAPENWATWCDLIDENDRPALRCAAWFDMERSGAGLAWDFFHPGQPRLALINRIEDRDLWRFTFADTRAVQACVFSYPYDFETWDRLFLTPLPDLQREGEAIERKHFKDIKELLRVTQRTMLIGGYAVPAASLPYTLASDAGNVMAQGERFAACYYDTPEARVFSLRSAPDGLDVSAIATSYGGGGHQHAAGFQVPRDHALARA
jgi:uncharacterized protein